jgi:hypothetical protein
MNGIRDRSVLRGEYDSSDCYIDDATGSINFVVALLIALSVALVETEGHSMDVWDG